MSAKRKGKRPTSRLVLEGSRVPLARQREDASGVKKLKASNGRMEETVVVRQEELSFFKTAESLLRELDADAGVKTEQNPLNNSVVKTEAAAIGDMQAHPHVNPQASPVMDQQSDSTVKTEMASLGAMEDPLDETRETAKPESSLGEPTPEGPVRLQTTIQGVTLSKMGADDDPEVFLSAFESAATHALWPKEQWAMRVAPFLSEEAYAIYQSLPFYTAEDYDQLKEALLDHTSMIEESYRKKFRSVGFTAGSKPSMVAHTLQDLGRRWLKPEIRSPDDILERIIIEQFIKILPAQAAEWLTQQHVRTLDAAVQLVEGYLAGEAVGRTSKAGGSNAWMPSWTQEPQAEGESSRSAAQGGEASAPATAAREKPTDTSGPSTVPEDTSTAQALTALKEDTTAQPLSPLLFGTQPPETSTSGSPVNVRPRRQDVPPLRILESSDEEEVEVSTPSIPPLAGKAGQQGSSGSVRASVRGRRARERDEGQNMQGVFAGLETTMVKIQRMQAKGIMAVHRQVRTLNSRMSNIDRGICSMALGMKSMGKGMESMGKGMKSMGKGMESMAEGVRDMGVRMGSLCDMLERDQTERRRNRHELKQLNKSINRLATATTLLCRRSVNMQTDIVHC
ncbi:uncharacterized protein LOC144752258 isoform X1 [Lissotriton helveticus]